MKSRNLFLCFLFALAAGLGVGARPGHAVQFLITYADAANTGFKDPVLGPQRRAAFEYAASYWSQRLAGNVPIEVKATFGVLASDANGIQLGGAMPTSTRENFIGATLKDTQYPIALANQLAGYDLAPSPGTTDIPAYEIDARFNSVVDAGTVLGSQHWYYGLDSLPPLLGTSADGNPVTDLDFLSTAIHEIGHGLGFFPLISENGAFFDEVPTVYDRFLANGITQTATRLTSLTEERRKAALISNNLFFAGPAARRAEGSGFNTRIYAPVEFETGSSVGHLDENTYHGMNELMTPYDTETINQAGSITLGVMADIGWNVTNTTSLPVPVRTESTPPVATGRFAYSAGGDIWVVNADGTGKRRVTSGTATDTDPTSSSNGDKIVFVSNRDGGDSELYMVNSTGTDLQRLTNSPGEDSEPSFRRDGKAIVFTSVRSGGNRHLFTLTFATGVVRNLMPTSISSDSTASFSPDSRRIVFTSRRDGNAEIYTLVLADGTVTRLTTDVATKPSEDTEASFNRAGDTVVFSGTRDGNQEIYKVPATGGAIVRMTSNLSADSAPQFSPFQNYIVFQSNLRGNFDLFTLSLTSTGGPGTLYRITRTSDVDIMPSWGGSSDTPAPTPTPTPVPTATGTPTPTPTPTSTPSGPEPPNNDFVNAQVITGATGTTSGSNVNGDHETGEPNHAGIAGLGSIWYKWTAPSNGSMKVETTGSSFDTTLAVYTGTSVGGLTLVAKNDDFNGAATSGVVFNAVAGTVYYIAVDGFDGETGDVVLTWTLTAVSPTPTPTPTSAPVKPDAMLGLNSTYVGNNVYSATPSVQHQDVSMPMGSTATYIFRVQNDAIVADTFRITAPSSDPGASVHYFLGQTGGAEITSQVTSGAGYTTVSVAPTASVFVRVTVQFTSFAFGNYVNRTSITVKSTSNTSAVDSVQAVTSLSSSGSSTTTRSTSSVQLSTASASAAAGEVALVFSGQLGATSASDAAHYRVLVNGAAVLPESAAYSTSQMTVHLALPLGAIRAGDSVSVAWSGLNDSNRNSVRDGQTVVTAK